MMYEYGPKPTTDLGAYVTIHSGATVVRAPMGSDGQD